MTSAYYRGAHGALLMFDLTVVESFDSLPRWVAEMRRSLPKDAPDINVVLVGCKADLAQSRRAVSFERATQYAQSLGVPYIETR